jgi:hypothetical protein
MSKKLKLSHETIRVLASDTLTGVAGGQASGSSGTAGFASAGCGPLVDADFQRRLDDLAKRRN